VPLPAYAATFLRAVPDAAVFVTAGGRLLAANRKARAAFALPSDCPPDCDLHSFVAGSSSAFADTLRGWARSTDPMPGSFTVAVDGTVTTYNGKGSVVVPANGDTAAVLLVRFWPRAEANPFVLLNQKVTELHDEVARRVQVEEALRRSEMALQERVSEAEALNRAKDEFLATVSHELRTPLNAILGWASLLRGRSLEPQTQKAIEVIHRNAQAQAKLVDDILDVSRIITGKMSLEPRAADLAALVDEAVEVVRPAAAGRHLTLHVTRGDDRFVLVADPDRIRQAVWNVLSNAVKFSERGGAILVDVRRSGSQFAVVVTDTGTGIDPAFLPHVFDRFRQADSSTTRRTGGLGLGLALVRSIVELHGGTVSAASDGPGRGATFTITLPVRALMEPSAPPSTVSVSAPLNGTRLEPGALRGIRTLVVDDEPDARELLATVLELAGSEVATAASVSAAVEVFPRFRPHVLVSDVGMPGENGYALLRRLRQLPEGAGGDVPAVALTAYTRTEDRREARKAGFTTHLGKPVSPDDLVQTVARLAARNRTTRPETGGFGFHVPM
jgi:signal transduction histidine kinase/CheY-like chemotaxis protein